MVSKGPESKWQGVVRCVREMRDLRMIKEIMLVPFPRAASRRLISFFTFHISICRGRLR